MAKEDIETYSHKNTRNTFGGIIRKEDFSIKAHLKYNLEGSPIASRIVEDWRFDEQCCKNIEARELRENG